MYLITTAVAGNIRVGVPLGRGLYVAVVVFHLDTCVLQPVMFADTLSVTCLALIAVVTVFADTCPPAFLTSLTLSSMLAQGFSAALLAYISSFPMHTKGTPSTVDAIGAYLLVYTRSLAPTWHAGVQDPSVNASWGLAHVCMFGGVGSAATPANVHTICRTKHTVC